MKRLIGVVLLGMLVAIGSFGEGMADSNWPKGAVKIYVPSKAGGFADAHARLHLLHDHPLLNNGEEIIPGPVDHKTCRETSKQESEHDWHQHKDFHQDDFGRVIAGELHQHDDGSDVQHEEQAAISGTEL